MARAPYIPRGWQDEERARYGGRNMARPEPGYFQMRLTKGGVFVPARILYAPTRDPETNEPLERSWYWHGIINGEPDPKPMPSPTDRVMRIWTGGRRIDKAEYDFLLADRTWAKQHAPDLPEARPNEAVDLAALPPVF